MEDMNDTFVKTVSVNAVIHSFFFFFFVFLQISFHLSAIPAVVFTGKF